MVWPRAEVKLLRATPQLLMLASTAKYFRSWGSSGRSRASEKPAQNRKFQALTRQSIAAALPVAHCLGYSPTMSEGTQRRLALFKDTGRCLPTVIWARWSLEREPYGKCRINR